MDLVPYALIHIGVSIALAANLILVYRRIHKADFLLYWAGFWLCIASALAASQVAIPLLTGYPGAQRIASMLTLTLIFTFPVLMICAGLSIGGTIRKRTAWRWLRLALGAGGVVGFWWYFSSQDAGSVGQFRPMMTTVALAFFTYRLAVKGRQEVGSSHAALVGVSAVYAAHNLFLSLSSFGVRIYPTPSYSEWAAVVGILLQFGLTMVFWYSAIERADEASREATEAGRRLHSLLETVGIAGVIVDQHGTVEFCNPWLAKALGLPSTAIVGSSWLDRFVPGREQDSVCKVFEAGFNTGQWPAIHEYSLECQGRTIELSWYHTSLLNASGAIIGAASLGIDMSQQKRLEVQVRQAQKMETLGRLAGGVAHDFNNHLTVINGFSDLLLKRFANDEKTREELRYIRKAGGLAATLTHQLLAFSRRRPVESELISLNAMVTNCVAILRRLIRENVELETDLAREEDFIQADPGHMDHVVLNLVLNANDAITGSGTIRIRTRRVTGDRPGSAVNGPLATEEFAVLEVEDTGAGMDEWTRGKVFEPFFTTKAEGKGTGLGLATVYGSVKQAGGWIDVRSQLGKGSVFSVYLPRAETRKGAGTADPQKIKKSASVGTILLVEDQDMVRRFTSSTLEREGYQVLVASSGDEAMRIVSDPTLELSVLVTDVVMPGMSGDELARRAREHRPGLATLFVSGYAFDHTAHLSDSPAPYAFLSKPYTAQELTDQVDGLVRMYAKAAIQPTLWDSQNEA